MRYAALAATALLALTATAMAQESIIVHPAPQAGTVTVSPGGGMEIKFPTHNDPNFLNYGPLPDDPGADKSQDYMDQAGGNDMMDSGPGSNVDSDIEPDTDGAYDE